MKRMLLTTLLIGLPAFALTPLLFPRSDSLPDPVGAQMPLFALLFLLEGLGLGLAVAILREARHLIPRLPEAQRRTAWVATLGGSWVLGNWWLHDGLHSVVGDDFNGLLAIEFGFHVTMMVAAPIVMISLLRLTLPEQGLSATARGADRGIDR